MKRTVLRMLAAATAAAALSVSSFAIIAAAQPDESRSTPNSCSADGGGYRRPAQGHEDQSSADR